MLPPITAEETTAMPSVITKTLIVSHNGPILERRYWQTVSSQAQVKPLWRLRNVRSPSHNVAPVWGMVAPVVASVACNITRNPVSRSAANPSRAPVPLGPIIAGDKGNVYG